MAVALLVGGGLLVKNLLRLHARDAGIRPQRIVASTSRLPGRGTKRPSR